MASGEVQHIPDASAARPARVHVQARRRLRQLLARLGPDAVARPGHRHRSTSSARRRVRSATRSSRCCARSPTRPWSRSRTRSCSTRRRKRLRRQTASADILRVISASPSRRQAGVRRHRHRRSAAAVVQLRDRVAPRWPDLLAGRRRQPLGGHSDMGPTSLPIDPAQNFPSRAILAKAMLHLPDWDAIDLPPHEVHIRRALNVRSALYLPLMREDECIGLLGVRAQRAARLRTPRDRAGRVVPRPGGDRHRERAAVQRDAGGAGAPDRQRRHPARHQQFPLRRAAGVRCHRHHRSQAPGLRHRHRADLQRRHLLAEGHGHPGRPDAGAGVDGDAGRPGGQLPVARDREQDHASLARLVGDRASRPRAGAARTAGPELDAVPAAAARRRLRWRAGAGQQAGERVQRQGDRAGGVVPRPGGDRHRERAAVQRDEGGARAAARVGRGARRDLATPSRTQRRCSTRSSRAASACSRARWA